MRSRWIGSARAVDLVIEVDAELPTAAAHEIADRRENQDQQQRVLLQEGPKRLQKVGQPAPDVRVEVDE